MKIKIYWFSILFLFVVFGCGRSVKEVPQQKLNGINGEAIYLFEKDGSISGVFKLKYNVHDYAILLVKDSIKLGEEFISSIYVTNPKHKITITSPTNEVISSEIDGENRSKGYSFKTQEKGVYDFLGRIEYDTMVIPFEYKFIVIE